MPTSSRASRTAASRALSPYSNDGSGNCISVANRTDGIAVRDSKNRTGPAFSVGYTAFSAFLEYAKAF
ncbi:DUF397 domain-containing protein [Streptomyces melanogenes]|uniref:DUF397 domain-containing protein n=1 Tax=Streptomyces melanogenes TaxID=67326 RepID=UPI00167EDE1B|nr:DUF397 domain-containing protein [Streptomyces melanogenes]